MNKRINAIIVDDEPVAREILALYVEKVKDIHLVKSCKNAVEAFQVLSEQNINLILLDINMPDMTGLSLAKVIDPKIKIIFTTAHREFAVEGFDLQAVDYLLKPISFERFQQAIQQLSPPQAIPKSTTNNYFFVRSNRKMVKIHFDDILYIESISDYIKIHLSQKNIVTRETISRVLSKLPAHEFLRIHRSFIIALQHIESYTKESVIIHGTVISISRSYREQVIGVMNGLSD